ncbi:glycosyltransferase [Lentzea sp. HUAS12]|uniref:glycosyltransferase n=1 Tax=Lentzea sp. HUAS12 TaxID=2951806 RepID=UPI0020A0FBCF|nr:glycosyltransferase [Lentzea sp. HUAS12]USX54701.1 glycosyltransferase [Lentzea sp. HUAS12]
MRIAMVSAQASPLVESTAQGAHVAELCAGLSASRYEVVVYTRRDDPESPDEVRTAEGYDVVHVPAGPAHELSEKALVEHLADFATFLAERWRLRPPDVVHAHHWTSGLVSLIGGHRLRVPVVHCCHGAGEAHVEQRSDAETLIARRAAWITATNTEEATRLWQSGVRRTQVSVLPSGVDSALFTPEGPADVHDGRVRVVVAGELDPAEGSAAIGAVLSTMDHVELVDAATVPRRDRPAVLRSADVAVCAPATEAYGTAALEAMACGVPVVATAVGALNDVVLPDVTGLLLPPHDGLRLARSLKSLLADETLGEQFSIAGRDRVLSRYSRRRLAREALAVYERVATPRRGRAGRVC